MPAISEPATTWTAMPSSICRSSISTDSSCEGNLPKAGSDRIQLSDPETWVQTAGRSLSKHAGPVPSQALRPTTTYWSGSSGCAARRSESSMASKQILGIPLRASAHRLMGDTAEMRFTAAWCCMHLPVSTILTACLVTVGKLSPGLTPTAMRGCLHSPRSRPAPSWSWTVVISYLGAWSSMRATGEEPRASVMGQTCALAESLVDMSSKTRRRSPAPAYLSTHEAGTTTYVGWMRAPTHLWLHIVALASHALTCTIQGIASLVTLTAMPMSSVVGTSPPGGSVGGVA
mmetsp:Transcript_28282/g.71657  ORF Transcript_28282/g.71657 Transcript_28282/m.71657 type:complete len:288 (+) Transcript_28282:766-1629(+)